jgi:dihydrofolate synthase/folylpolyglutamate synthase
MDRFLAKLYSRINYERQVRVEPKHFKLNNLRALLARLGNPQLNYPIVHIAGTKGKGSVATMLANILAASGRQTGLFTSPHLVRINQRVTINGISISDADFESILGQLDVEIRDMDLLCQEIRETQCNPQLSEPYDEDWTAIDPKSNLPLTGKPLTFFEVMTAAAFLYYSQKNCDAVVLEVGLGGRLDSTNVCQPSACVITNISLDHTRQLGSTIDKIAFEKAGIIKNGVPVVSGELKPLAADVISAVAKERGSDLVLLQRDFQFVEHFASDLPEEKTDDGYAVDISYSGRFVLPLLDNAASDKAALTKVAKKDEKSNADADRNNDLTDSTGSDLELSNLKVAMLGRHQRSNAALAVATIQLLNCQGWSIAESAIRAGLSKTTLAGRTQVVRQSPAVVLDVAHNVASVNVLLETLKQELAQWHSAPKKTLILSISKDKDCRSMLEVLLPEFDQVVITKYQENPRAVDPERLLSTAREVAVELELNGLKISVVEKPLEAWHSTAEVASAEDVICFAGSVFLIAEVIQLFNPGQ